MLLSTFFLKIIRYCSLATLLAAIFFQYLPIPAMWTVSIVILFTILMWALQLFSPWFVALLFITSCCLGKLVEPNLALQGFVASGTWLVFAGLVIGQAMKHTGLAKDLAVKIAPLLKGGFTRALFGFMVFGLICVFIMPSAMGRVVLLLPIFQALSLQLGYGEKTEEYTHLLLGGVFATYMPAFAVLPANVPNTVLLGATESLFGHGPEYLHYLIVHFPLLGFVKFFLIFLVLWGPLRNTTCETILPAPLSIQGNKEKQIPKKRLLLILCGMLLLWITEPLHGLSTAWIAMLATIFCLLPSMKVLPEKPLEKFNLSPILYVAGVISLGAVASHSELIVQLENWIDTLFKNFHPSGFLSFIFLSTLSTITGLLVTLPAAPAVLTPLTESLSSSLGLPFESVYLTQIIGLSTVWLPYQAPPLIIAKAMGNIPWNKLTRYCFITALLSLLILWPLDYVWWSFLRLL